MSQEDMKVRFLVGMLRSHYSSIDTLQVMK